MLRCNDISKRIRLIKKYSSSKIPQEIKTILPELINAAQEEYDKWEQDEEGYGESYGYGGICHLIAERIIDRISAAGITCTTVSSDHEVHVYSVIRLPNSSATPGIYEVDIRPYIYETGGGYIWKKIPYIKFDESCIDVTMLSPNPKDFKEYIGEYDEIDEDMEEDDGFIPKN